MWKTIEQVKSLENIIASGEIKVDEAAQLWELYIIKLKRDILMLENNVNNFSEEKISRRLKNRNQRRLYQRINQG